MADYEKMIQNVGADVAPLRIMHIMCSADPTSGGPVEGATQLGNVWRSLGHVQHLVTMDSPDEPFVQRCPSPVIALGRSLRPPHGKLTPLVRWKGYRYTSGAVDWIRSNAENYDVAVVSGLWNYATLAARRALVGGTLPYIVFTHGMLDPWFRVRYPIKHWIKQFFWLFNEGVLLRNAGAVVFTRDEERKLAHGTFFPYALKPAVIGYGTADISGDRDSQISAFFEEHPFLRNKKFLLFLSRIHPKKGCDLLIEAFSKIARSNSELYLVMAGPDQGGWRQELEELGRVYGVADRIYWSGMVRGGAKWGAFHACEAFVLTSHSENFGIAVAEAMACSKPVLITNKINIWPEIASSGGGFVEEDTQAGADLLMQKFLACSSEQLEEMGRKARACFEQHFLVNNAGVRAIELMRRVRREARTGE